MFTERGLAHLAASLAADLENAQIVVTDGENQDGASVTKVAVDGAEVTATAVFGEDKANFDWKERWLILDGTVIDSETADFGRKSAGAVWSIDAVVDLRTGSDGGG